MPEDPHGSSTAERAEKTIRQAARDTVLEVKDSPITGECVNRRFPQNAERLLIKGNGEVTFMDSAAYEAAELPLRLIGTDAASIGMETCELQTHKAFLSKGIVILEGLDLSEVEPGNYFLIALPMKIGGAEGAPVRAFLAEKGLSVNPSKEDFYTPGIGWTFLGFSYRDGVVDIAPATVKKLKQKMRRKARALQRWRKRNGLSGEKAAAAFIRIFNRKLLENSADSDLTWSYWFFSVIDTADSLHEIDLYAQDCLRFLISGTRTKARFNVRYEDLKKLGYRSLVHAYYSFTTSP